MKTKFLLSIVLLFSFWNNSFAQVGVGTSNPQGALDITSTTNGVLIPRVTLTALATYAPVVNPTTGLAPVTGTLVWNNGVSLSPAGFYYWNGTAWTALGGSSSGTKWDLLGNVVGPVGTNFIGSTDNNPISFRTNNIEKLRLNAGSQLLGGPISTPTAGIVGSSLVPFYSFLGNQGSGMWSPALSKLAFSTGSNERMRIDSNGYIGMAGPGGTALATTAPEAMLDIRSNSKGILIPRVALTSSIVMAPVTTAINSELVYNTATAGTSPNNVTPGFYYWTTTPAKWNKVGGSVDVKSGSVSATGTLFEPNAPMATPYGASVSLGTNSTAGSVDNASITRDIIVPSFAGLTGNVTCNVKFNTTFASDVQVFLQSPTGQIIALVSNRGGASTTNFNVTFSDFAASNISTWTTGDLTGTFQPQTTNGVGAAYVITPNITTMSGFNGNSPIGTWTLTFADDDPIVTSNFISWSLDISPQLPLNYRLVGETSLTYKTGTNLVVNSMYSANPDDDGGFVTALTRSTASAGALGTTIAALPGTVISYASDSPKQGNGNYWATTYNQAVPTGLVDGTTYYFQLWSKGNIPTPFSSNELFSLIPMIIPQ